MEVKKYGKEYYKEWRKNNKAHILAYAREWRKNNKVKISNYMYNYRHPKSLKTNELIQQRKEFLKSK